jgi:hypothetical protein
MNHNKYLIKGRKEVITQTWCGIKLCEINSGLLTAPAPTQRKNETAIPNLF